MPRKSKSKAILSNNLNVKKWNSFNEGTVSCLGMLKRILRSCYYSVVEWVLRQSNAEKKLELDDITVYAKKPFARSSAKMLCGGS